MYIQNLCITNFRNISSKQFQFSVYDQTIRKLTPNELDALTIGISAVLHEMSVWSGCRIQSTDYMVSTSPAITVQADIDELGDSNERIVVWTRKNSSCSCTIRNVVNLLRINTVPPRPLPLIVRIPALYNVSCAIPIIDFDIFNRLKGYDGALESSPINTSLASEFFQAVNDPGFRSPLYLQAYNGTKAALKLFIRQLTGKVCQVKYSEHKQTLAVIGDTFPIPMHSLFKVVIDLAVRAALLDPHYGKMCCQKISGIVIIDNTVNDHSILTALQKTFPRVQFIFNNTRM